MRTLFRNLFGYRRPKPKPLPTFVLFAETLADLDESVTRTTEYMDGETVRLYKISGGYRADVYIPGLTGAHV